MLELCLETLTDALRLLPFLFITYLIMEYMEHKMSSQTKEVIRRSGRFGPVLGAVAGIVPQCGFSASASGLYAGRVITLGTLLAIFLSTSDEMLPILISEQMQVVLILKILVLKLMIAIVAGVLIDLLFNKTHESAQGGQEIGTMCEHEHCRCKEGVFSSALRHTLQIFFFILIISFGLNLLLSYIGEEALQSLILGRPVLGHILAALVGMIPNCASSVLLTRLYVEGLLSLGTMMSGLLAGSGVGMLVLFRVNHSIKENAEIAALVFSIGVGAGLLLDIIGFV